MSILRQTQRARGRFASRAMGALALAALVAGSAPIAAGSAPSAADLTLLAVAPRKPAKAPHSAPAAAPPPAPAAAPPTPAALAEVAARLQTEAQSRNGAWTRLAWLTDRIGPRLSGSPGAEAAVAWALEEFRRDGLANVRGEPVMVPRWVRGEETVTILTPVERPVVATAVGMSVPTPPGGIAAEVIETDSLESLRALGDRVKGKIVLFSRETPVHPDGEGYAATSPMRGNGPSEAARLGAVAVLVRSLGTLRARLPHTGATFYKEDAPKIPAAAIAEEDALRMHRFLEAGESVMVKMVLGCRTLPDVASANVVADLRGRERPDEIVVVGGHLDSWDLGDGAVDDGAGVVVAMETLSLLKRLGLTPRRTVRAVLYMNEENGSRGGRAYAQSHHDDLARHVAAIESDSGAGHLLGLRLAAGPGGVEVVRGLLDVLSAGRPAGLQVEISESAGVDIDHLKPGGVPLLGMRQDETHYFDWHHTMADTLDKVEPRTLAENAAALAFLAWALAESPDPLPRLSPPASPAP